MTGYALTTDSLKSYLSDVNRYPLLNKEEEFDIAERYWRLKNIEDAHKLVASNLRYVIKIALEYRNYGCRLSDLIQEGNIGLMVAVKRFDPYKGYRLITYATWWIRAFIQDFILRTTGLVRRGGRALKKKLFYRKPADNKLAGDPGSARLALPDGEEAALSADLSLNSPIDAHSVAGDGVTHLDMLKDNGPAQEETFAAKEGAAVIKKEVSGALSLLNDKERLIIENRVMADEPESLQGIGDRLGLTRERVRQIEASALKKLRKALSSKTDILEVQPAR